MEELTIPECELYRCNESTIAADRLELQNFVQTAMQQHLRQLEKQRAILAALTAQGNTQLTA